MAPWETLTVRKGDMRYREALPLRIWVLKLTGITFILISARLGAVMAA